MTIQGIELTWGGAVLILAGLVSLIVVGVRTMLRRRRVHRVLRQTSAAVRTVRRGRGG